MPQIIVIVALVVPLGFVAFNRLRSDLAALIIVILLALAQWAGWAVLGRANTPADAVKAIAGFGQPVVLTLISLFIVSVLMSSSKSLISNIEVLIAVEIVISIVIYIYTILYYYSFKLF